MGDKKKRLELGALKAAIEQVQGEYAFSERRACRVMTMAVTTYRYRSVDVPSRINSSRLVVINLFEIRSRSDLRLDGSNFALMSDGSRIMALMKMPAKDDRERFQSEADKYAAYLETPEGRLRLDLPFANLQEFLPLPPAQSPLRALDLGCGTGANGVRLARLGFHVTLLDSSPAMLDIAKHAAQEAGIPEKIELKHGDADQSANLFREGNLEGTFDVILIHNVLEFVADPGAVLGAAASVLRNSSAILSVLVRNRAGEVLKAAILAGDLAAAEQNLTARWSNESLYGGSVRLFEPGTTRAMLNAASLDVLAERGVRVMSDYLSPRISVSAEYERVFELERKLGRRPDFAAVARYTHSLARRAGPVMAGPATKDRA